MHASSSPLHSCPGRPARPLTRRDLLKATANGFGLLALAGLMADDSAGAEARPHCKPRAKNVIFCFMDGGVAHVDSFDPKPKVDSLLLSFVPKPRKPGGMDDRVFCDMVRGLFTQRRRLVKSALRHYLERRLGPQFARTVLTRLDPPDTRVFQLSVEELEELAGQLEDSLGEAE